jgi:hypothetical protein
LFSGIQHPKTHLVINIIHMLFFSTQQCSFSKLVIIQPLFSSHMCFIPHSQHILGVKIETCRTPNLKIVSVQVMGPEPNWTHIVAEVIQVLRENPHTFDIMGAYNYMAINATQDGRTNGDMADMERQIWEEESNTKADDDVPASKKFPKMVISLFYYLGIKSTQVMMKVLIAESPSWYHDLALLYEALIPLWKFIGILGMISNVR